MKREFPEAPLVGVGAIIVEKFAQGALFNRAESTGQPIDHQFDNARVVLVKRAHPPLEAQWSIPGGVLEVGELVRDAAIREAYEETGLIVETGELLGVFDRVLRSPDGRVQYHYVLVDFLCRRVGGELKAAGDAADARWFTGQELPSLNLAADTLEVIRKGFERIQS